MRPLDPRKYLFDVMEACELLEQFTAGKTFEDYESDTLVRSGVERQFGIIGEALGLAIRTDPGLVLWAPVALAASRFPAASRTRPRHEGFRRSMAES